jgi:putative ABC transport system permease protein
MAHLFFPGRTAVGERLVVDGEAPVEAEIVGIAGDTRIFGQAVEAPPIVYLSLRQHPRRSAYVVLRMAADPTGAAPLLRSTVGALDPTIAVGRMQTLRELLDASRAQPRLRTGLVVLFAGVALALTLGGLYGALSWAVAQRTRELGVRMALGATPRSLTTLVLTEGARVVLPGVAAGIAGGLVAARQLRDLLFDVQPFEPMLVAAVACAVTLLALLAVVGPGRRAARVDPLVALRTD